MYLTMAVHWLLFSLSTDGFQEVTDCSMFVHCSAAGRGLVYSFLMDALNISYRAMEGGKCVAGAAVSGRDTIRQARAVVTALADNTFQLEPTHSQGRCGSLSM